MGLRAGSTPSRSLETKEKCLATLTFMGKDYHHHHHPQQPPGEESGSFSIAETVDCSKPPDPASPRPCTCRLFFQQPYKWLHDISPWACVYTYTPVALHACDLPHVRQASQRVPASAFASVWASAEMANLGARTTVCGVWRRSEPPAPTTKTACTWVSVPPRGCAQSCVHRLALASQVPLGEAPSGNCQAITSLAAPGARERGGPGQRGPSYPGLRPAAKPVRVGRGHRPCPPLGPQQGRLRSAAALLPHPRVRSSGRARLAEASLGALLPGSGLRQAPPSAHLP